MVGLSVTPAATPGEESVRARLVADSASLVSGKEIQLGVFLEMDPGWHVYWRNPGDAGLATEVEFDLPDGFVTGSLRWPTPISFTQPGDLAAYGYENEVLLAIPVRVPDGDIGGRVPVAASVSWLACKDVCVVGSAELRGELPMPDSGALFEIWRERSPMPNGPFSLGFSDGLAEDERRGTVSLWLEWSEPPGEVEFFPDTGERLKISEATVRTRGNLTRIDFRAAVIGGGDGMVDRVPSVVTSTDRAGERRGWVFDAPLRDDFNID